MEKPRQSSTKVVLSSTGLLMLGAYLLFFRTLAEEPHLVKRSNILDNTAIRVLIGIGVFAVFNVVAITGHHIVQKVSRSSRQYKEIEHNISAF